MNVSFLVLGVAMILGSILTYHGFNTSRKTAIGFGSIAVGGFGVILVGLFPENSIPALHGIGSTLPFLIGNMGILLLSVTLNEIPKWLRVYSAITALIALSALIFYGSGHFLGLGEGGIERIVAYPQTVWLVIIGLYGIYRSSRKT